MNVHHMPGGIIRHGNILLQFRFQSQVVERVLRRKIRRGKIIIAICHMHLEMRIDRDRFAQCLGDIDVLIFMLGITPRLHTRRENFVRQVGFKFQFAAHVIVERCGVGSHNVCETGIVIVDFARRVSVDAFESAVETTDGAAFIAQQLFGEPMNLDAQIRLIDVLSGQARVAC